MGAIKPDKMEINVVWNNSVNPIAKGWFIRKNKRPTPKVRNIKNNCKMTEGSLLKY